jgi:hypothetical protein
MHANGIAERYLERKKSSMSAAPPFQHGEQSDSFNADKE